MGTDTERRLRFKSGALLHGQGYAQYGALVKMPAQNLQSNWQPGFRLPAGNADSRDSRQVGSDRIDVRQIHGQRVVCFFTQLEGWCWRGGSDDDVHFPESLFKIAGQERAYALGFQ